MAYPTPLFPPFVFLRTRPELGPNQNSQYIPPLQITVVTHQPLPGYLQLPYNVTPEESTETVPKVTVPKYRVPTQMKPTRPWTDPTVQPSDAEFATFVTKQNGRFLMKIDLQSVEPNNVLVTVRNGFLIVNARHDEKLDAKGYVSSQFCRRYKIDDVEAVTTKYLVSGGMLKIMALLKPPPVRADARKVPILLSESVLD